MIVAPCGLEAVVHAPVLEKFESLGTNRRAGHVTDEALEPAPIASVGKQGTHLRGSRLQERQPTPVALGTALKFGGVEFFLEPKTGVRF